MDLFGHWWTVDPDIKFLSWSCKKFWTRLIREPVETTDQTEGCNRVIEFLEINYRQMNKQKTNQSFTAIKFEMFLHKILPYNEIA